MSTAELIEAIKTLPPEKQKQVESFVHQLVGKGTEGLPFNEAADAVFAKHETLLRELAK